jgi:hypothetical protein
MELVSELDIYMLVMFVVEVLIVKQDWLSLRTYKGMVRFNRSKPHPKFCSLTDPIQ